MTETAPPPTGIELTALDPRFREDPVLGGYRYSATPSFRGFEALWLTAEPAEPAG